MTQPMPPIALSLWAQTQAQPLPLSPTPASVPWLQLQRTSVGGRLPAPQPPCPPWNAGQKTRYNRSAPDWGQSLAQQSARRLWSRCSEWQFLLDPYLLTAPRGQLKEAILSFPSFTQYSLSTYSVPVPVPGTGNTTESKRDKACVLQQLTV